MDIHCVSCDKKLEPVNDDGRFSPYQPWKGVVCTTEGNFGSQAFDSIRGTEELIFALCDECLRKAKHRMWFQEVTNEATAEWSNPIPVTDQVC